MNRKLLNLLARNARKGEFRAESGDSGNRIYVYDVIVAADADAEWFGGVSAESFVKALKGMSGDVEIRVNSPGGDVFGGKAMAAAMREYQGGTITTYVDGYAASAASHLVTNAGKAIMGAGAMVMIHQAWTIDIGNAEDFRKTAALLDKIDGTIAADYAASAERRGVEPPDFAAMMAAETWFTAEEAVAAGLADEVAESGPKSSVDWDLSVYDHAPCKPKSSGTVTINIDTAEIRAAIDDHVSRIRAELGLSGTGGEEATDEPDEIETARRLRVADLQLRPAA